MYNFSKSSLEKYATCHPDLQKVLSELIKIYDFKIIEGHRTLATQQKYYSSKRSKLDGIKRMSKHQYSPSLAVDIMPCKKGTNAFSGNEKDSRRFYFMMGIVRGISTQLKNQGVITHDIRFGADWDSDDVYTDQTFDDLPHMELT